MNPYSGRDDLPLPELSRRNHRRTDESHDIYEIHLTLSSQRQQRQPQPLTQQRPHSRPSSSSGSTRSLRRTPRFEQQGIGANRHLVRAGTRAVQPPFAQYTQALGEEGDDSTTQKYSRESAFWPRRSTRISRRTASAILYALEEAIRKPNPFTPDLVEESASMADLGPGGPSSAPVSNGRAQNGGSRTVSGPVPVPQNPSERVRTPTEIMRQRIDREARKKAETESRQREQQGNGVTAGDAPGDVGLEGRARTRRPEDPTATRPTGAQRTQDIGSNIQGNRPSRGPAISQSTTSQPQAPIPTNDRSDKPTAPPPGETSRLNVPQTQRSRGESQPHKPPASQQQPQQQPPPGRRTASAGTQPQSRPRQTSAPAAATQAQTELPQPASNNRSQIPQGSAGGSQQRTTNTSSFPHAFERWETLSSHWEGLTSFWIRRLQQNGEELERNPLNSQLARQVNDLSAAGANLFHAVVELQRLRASSERKFQRWFFETRAEQERAQEIQAGLEESLRKERQAKADAIATLTRAETDRNSASQTMTTAEQMVKEMRRELQISKEEARRAWEELGRMVQMERDRTASLRSGAPTLIGSIQVVPMMPEDPSRQGSTNRPSTRGEPYQQGVNVQSTQSAQESVGSAHQDDRGYTNYDPAQSDTDTDPFTEGSRPRPSQAVPPLPPNIPRAQQTSNSSAAALQAAQMASQSGQTSGVSQVVPSTSNPGGTYLQYGPRAPNQPVSSFYQHEGSSLLPEGQQPRATEADERSYVASMEESLSQEEYEMNSNGEIRYDAHGQPIPFRRSLPSDNSDEYDVQDQLEQERMYGQRYGSGISGVEYGHGPTRTAGPPSTVDYSGSGYGTGPGWEAVPRHHHPTRLSDVLEEDERTNRTSPSRASQR